MIVIFHFLIYCLKSFLISTKCYKMNVVREIAGRLQFPSRITQPRINRDKLGIIFVIIINLVIFFFNTNSNKFFFEISISFSFWILFYSIAEVIKRITFLFEELFHLESRYDSNIHNLLDSIISFSARTTISFVLSSFTLLILFFKTSDLLGTLHGIGITKLLTSLMTVYLLKEPIRLNECELQISRRISEMDGLDYGSGMAYSFFSGYLQIILPWTGDGRLCFRQLIRHYEDRHGINFAVDKLFILIPTSLFCPPTFPSGPGIEIERCEPLDEIVLSRAGVINRVYKNSVYKIYDNREESSHNNKYYYVSMEYATPSRTLYDVVTQNSPHANIYKKHVKELQTQFYRTLHNILKSRPDCSDSCELLYYNDIDEHKQPLNNVGEVVINRIHEIMAT